MIAYHGEQAVKTKYLGRVRAHREAEELLQGHGYWGADGKGCAVGCTIHGSDLGAYETELGIPRIIARLEDGLFERLPATEAQAWPERFLEAITPGADLGAVWPRFAHWLLIDETEGVIRFAKTAKTREAIQRAGELYGRKAKGEKVTPKEFRAAAADAAAAAAAAAADYAAADYAAAAAAAARRKVYAEEVRMIERMIECGKEPTP